MAEEKKANQSLMNLNITVVALVALVAIVGVTAIVLNGRTVDNKGVSSNEQNVVGSGIFKSGECSGTCTVNIGTASFKGEVVSDNAGCWCKPVSRI